MDIATEPEIDANRDALPPDLAEENKAVMDFLARGIPIPPDLY